MRQLPSRGLQTNSWTVHSDGRSSKSRGSTEGVTDDEPSHHLHLYKNEMESDTGCDLRVFMSKTDYLLACALRVFC